MNTVTFNFWKTDNKIKGIVGGESKFEVENFKTLNFDSNDKLERFLNNHFDMPQHVIVWLDPEMEDEAARFDFDLTIADEGDYQDELECLRFALGQLTEYAGESLGMVEA